MVIIGQLVASAGAVDINESQRRSFAKVKEDLQQFDHKLKAHQSEFKLQEDIESIEWVKLKLAHMVKVDQFMRNQSMSNPSKGYDQQQLDYFKAEFKKYYQSVDREHTQI